MPIIEKLSDVVTDDELRAMLGVAVKEMKNGTTELPVYLRSVKVQSDRTDKRAWKLYAALGADRTAYSEDEEAFSDLYLTFLAWSTARVVAIALPQFSPQEIGDGKALMQRNDDASVTTIANIDRQIGEVVPLLVAAIDVLQPAQAAQVTTAFSVATFGATGDPVTGT
jgi:hypothetical protein